MLASMHPIDELFQKLAEVEPYPRGIRRVDKRIPGLAFFPGGWGLWGKKADFPPPVMPKKGIMVLGHDFHSERNYLESLEKRGAERNATWRILKQILPEGGVSLERCFFTNLYMGLREGDISTGRFPGAGDSGFLERCLRFLECQLSVQAPKLLITLGKWVPPLLAKLSPDLDGWSGCKNFAGIDSAGPFIEDAKIRALNGVVICDVIALTHPSLRAPNVYRRRYREFSGSQAEIEMLKYGTGRMTQRTA